MRLQIFSALVGVAGIASAATIPQSASGTSTLSGISTASGTSAASGTVKTSGTVKASGTSTASGSSSTATGAGAITKIDNKVLILARDADGANSASAGLSGYGIPFEPVLIPKEGGAIPTLNATATEGKYSGIIVIDALAYDYGADGWRSAVTADQWNTLWAYQANFKVRMVRINEFPGPSFGAGLAGAGGCCDTGVEQLISFTNTTLFATANLKT